jgi:hypothetical protein
VDDVEAYNNHDEMPLFTHFCKKIDVVEKNLCKRHIAMETKKCQGESCYGGG